MAGVDLRTVAQLMGHMTIQMTMRYEPLAPDHQLNAVERIVTTSAGDSTEMGLSASHASGCEVLIRAECVRGWRNWQTRRS